MDAYTCARADSRHIHHRLLDFGLTQPQTCLLFYCSTGILGSLGLLALAPLVAWLPEVPARARALARLAVVALPLMLVLYTAYLRLFGDSPAPSGGAAVEEPDYSIYSK